MYKIHVLLTSALVGSECGLQAPAALVPGKKPPIDWIGGWVDPRPRSGQHGEVNIFVPIGTQTPTPRSFSLHPVAILTMLLRLTCSNIRN
jgi:hypothetical protein